MGVLRDMFAIVRTGGKQYIVREGETLRVEKLPIAEVRVVAHCRKSGCVGLSEEATTMHFLALRHRVNPLGVRSN